MPAWRSWKRSNLVGWRSPVRIRVSALSIKDKTMQEIGLDIEQQAIDEAMIELGLQGLNEVTDKIKFHEVVARKRKELKDKFKKF